MTPNVITPLLETWRARLAVQIRSAREATHHDLADEFNLRAYLVDLHIRELEAALVQAEAHPPREFDDFEYTVGAAFDEARGCLVSPGHAVNLWCYWPNSMGEPCAECLRLRRAIDKYKAAEAPHPPVKERL